MAGADGDARRLTAGPAARMSHGRRRPRREPRCPSCSRHEPKPIDPASTSPRPPAAASGPTARTRAPRARRAAPPDRPPRARARRALRLRLPAPRASSGASAPPAARGCSASPSSSAIRDALADAARARRAPSSRAAADVEERNRELLERMIAEPGASTTGCGSRNEDIGEPGCKPLALPPALGHARDAAGLVAGQALLRLPVSRGAASAPRPARTSPEPDGDEARASAARRGPAAPKRRRRGGASADARRRRRAGRAAPRAATPSARRRPGARSRWSSSPSSSAS